MQLSTYQQRLMTWVLLALVAVLGLWFLAPVLAPFVIAAVLAYALTPLVDRLDGLGRGACPRVVAVVVVEVLFVLVLASLFLLMVPILAKELPLLREQVPLLVQRLNVQLSPWLAQMGVHTALDVESIKAFVFKYLNANFEDVFGSLLTSLKLGGSVALALVGNAILVPVALFYLLMDWSKLLAHVQLLVPPRWRAGVNSFTAESDSVLGQYLRGQLLVMLIMAVFYALGLGLFGLDLAVPIGVFTGLAMFIPYVGFGIGLLLAVLAGVLQFTLLKAVVMVAVVYGVGQLLESLYLTPRLVGERIGLHPLAVIFSLMAFGQLFGLVGVLIALPVSAVLLVGFRRLKNGYLRSGLYQANPPAEKRTQK